MGVGGVHYLCDDCWEQIEFLMPPWCQICGVPLNSDSQSISLQNRSCSDCRKRLPPYRKLRSIALYEPVLREAIHLLKYDRKQILAKHLMRLIQAHLPADLSAADYDFLCPIPLHTNRYRGRGFNQAERIAQGITAVWNVPIRSNILIRVKDTVPQSSLSSHEERLENIAGAFEVRNPDLVRDRGILLIDDIFTTGTTVNEALQVLQTASPAYVDVFTLARVKPASSQI